MKKIDGFSLIEVVFAAAFLIMVGVAMMALNAAASRLVTTAELKMTAEGLNEEALNVMALKKKTLTATDAFQTTDGTSSCVGASCYVVCDPQTIDQACSIVKTPQGVRVTTSRNTYTTEIKISTLTNVDADKNKYLVIALTSWGSGINKQLKGARILE